VTAPRAEVPAIGTLQTIAVLCTPLWIILATVLYSLANGELSI
jgi:hypothetical protein